MSRSLFSRAASAITAVAVLCAFSVVPAQAAGVAIAVTSPDQKVFTVTPTGVNLGIGDTFNLKLTNTSTGAVVDLSGNHITAITIGGVSEFAQVTDNGDLNGLITVTSIASDPVGNAPIVFTLNSALSANAAYTVSYFDSAGNFGAGSVNFGTANTVTLTATVPPVLTMAVADTSVLGPVSTSSVTSAAGSTTVTVGTNAASGYTLKAVSSTSDVNMPIVAAHDIDNSTNHGFAAYGFSFVKGTSAGALTAGAGFDGSGLSTNATLPLSPIATIATESKPTANDVVTVKYQAAAAPDTPAGVYTLTTTYTVTGSF